MREVDIAEGRKLEATHVCDECGEPLVMCWGGKWGISHRVVRCAINVEHEGLRKKSCPPREALPIELRNVLERKERKQMTEQYGEEAAMVVSRYQGVTSLNKEQATDIIQTFWPDAPLADVYKAALTCATYGLNPIMGHLYLVSYWNKAKSCYDWVQTFGISVPRLLASRKGGVSYIDDTPRIMSDAEQEKIRGVIEPPNWWAICKIRDKHGQEAVGYGKWGKEIAVKGGHKGNTPQNMAMIRAERAALNKKFPGEMPQNVEVIDDAYMNGGREHSDTVLPVSEQPQRLAERTDSPAEVALKPEGDVPIKKAQKAAVKKAAPVEKPTEKHVEATPKHIKELCFWLDVDEDGLLKAAKERFDPLGDRGIKALSQMTGTTAQAWIDELQAKANDDEKFRASGATVIEKGASNGSEEEPTDERF